MELMANAVKIAFECRRDSITESADHRSSDECRV